MPEPKPGFLVTSSVKTYSVEAFTPHFFSSIEQDGIQTIWVIDSLVAKLHLQTLEPILQESRAYLFRAEEDRKSFESVAALIQFLIDSGFRRNGRIIAVGGGIVQDVVGFEATIFMRGVSWTLIPTTLLAQADSCIGGKSGINFSGKKNIIGTFFPPDRVLIDTRFLNSLSRSDLQSGIGEMMHYFFYENSPSLNTLVTNYHQLLQNPTGLEPYIWECLNIKRRVIEIDEHDRGERNKFNYGHTFGHALEAVSNYSISHGLAVTVGMDLANYLSMSEGYIRAKEYRGYRDLLRVNFPQYDLSAIDIGEYLNCLRSDKKNTSSNLRCVLMAGIGKLFLAELAFDDLLTNRIADYFKSASV